MTETTYPLFASCSRGLDGLLAAQLHDLGLSETRCAGGGVYFQATLQQAYEVILYARVANSVLLILAQGLVGDAQQLYDLVATVDWPEHFPVSARMKVEFIGTNAEIRHTGFGAQRVKDAVVDVFSQRFGERPEVDVNSPDVMLQFFLAKNRATVSLNLSGPSLHRRGYRAVPVKAPLKETLAAALLMRLGWPAEFESPAYLLDPMCGSGTLLIEAALLQLGIAPGLIRAAGLMDDAEPLSDGFGFHLWHGHEPALWSRVVKQACAHRAQVLDAARQMDVRFKGYDCDHKAVRAARANIAAAGLQGIIDVSLSSIEQLASAKDIFLAKDDQTQDHNKQGLLNSEVPPIGLMIVNPPYGERLGEKSQLSALYQTLGERAKAGFEGWQLGVFTGNSELARAMRLRAKKKYRFMNGPIASELWLCDLINANQAILRKTPTGIVSLESLSEGSLMVLNRLKKNHKRLKRWREKTGVGCYRIFDADMPEFACAIDVYEDAIHVQEYAAPKNIPQNVTTSRLNQLLAAVSCFFQCPIDSIAYKVRQRQSGESQYQRLEQRSFEHGTNGALVVTEGQARLEVNLNRYLDTGLFLDHRPLRKIIYDTARQKRFLNLFCYTASATVQAALGGAKGSVSVDLSNTYLQWAERNFRLNGINAQQHQLINADCLVWLKSCRDTFDIIMLDPPTFSNSKKMKDVLDVQRDHVTLILDALGCLATGGVLYFSTNLRSFKMDTASLIENCQLEDITQQSVDMDFSRNQRIHQCWRMTHNTPVP